MKVQIIYVKGHTASEKQANESLLSFLEHGYDAKLVEGITPETINESDFPFPVILNGKLDTKFSGRKLLIKKSCLFNNLKFAQRVLEQNETMIFAEHDSICIRKLPKLNFDDCCLLNLEYAFKQPSRFKSDKYRLWTYSNKKGIYDLPQNFPMNYIYNNKYHNHKYLPGTASYALSPSGAIKTLTAAKRNGLEQSDLHINTYNMRIQYLIPSPIKLNKINLNLSHNLEKIEWQNF